MVPDELLSLLTLNPRLQDVSFYRLWINHTEIANPAIHMPMHNLQRLSADSEPHSISEVIRQFSYPNNIEHISLTAVKCVADSISTTLGGLARDHFMREGRVATEQGLFLQCFPKLISVQVSSHLDNDEQAGLSTFSRLSGPLYPRRSQ